MALCNIFCGKLYDSRYYVIKNLSISLHICHLIIIFVDTKIPYGWIMWEIIEMNNSTDILTFNVIEFFKDNESRQSLMQWWHSPYYMLSSSMCSMAQIYYQWILLDQSNMKECLCLHDIITMLRKISITDDFVLFFQNNHFSQWND